MKIHQVKTRLVNTYVVEYPQRLFVMDVAVRCHAYVLGFIEQELERNIQDVELVLCSHDDPDHMGGVRKLAALCNARIAKPHYAQAHRKKIFYDPAGMLVRAVTALREGARGRAWDMYFNPKRGQRARQEPRYRHVSDNARSGSAQITGEMRLKHRQTLPDFDDWLVLHTPGHSWDSCCYYHAQSGSLLTGDTLLGSAKQARVVVPAVYSNATQMQASLKLLRELDIRAVYPGHGSVINKGVKF